jgi:hypothetical protein
MVPDPPPPGGAQVPACTHTCLGAMASCQQPAADQCSCPKGTSGPDCSPPNVSPPDTVYLDAKTLMETRQLYRKYRTGMPAGRGAGASCLWQTSYFFSPNEVPRM